MYPLARYTVNAYNPPIASIIHNGLTRPQIHRVVTHTYACSLLYTPHTPCQVGVKANFVMVNIVCNDNQWQHTRYTKGPRGFN